MANLGDEDTYIRQNGILVPLAKGQSQSPTNGGGGTTTSTFSLAVDENFDSQAPTLKNGETLAGTSLEAYQGIQWYLADPDLRGATDYPGLADNDDLYNYARRIAEQYAALLVGLRLTGDPIFLDELVRVSDVQYSVLAVGWRDYDPAIVLCGGDSSCQHAHRIWVARGGGAMNQDYGGTDCDSSNVSRTHAFICRIARALDANRGVTSPAGYDYGAKADQWIDYLQNDFIHAWQGHLTETYVTNHDGYHGIRDQLTGRYEYNRADTGQWPILYRKHLHTNVGQAMLNWEWGHLFDDANAIQAAKDMFADYMDLNVLTVSNPSYGDSVTWARTLQFLDWAENQYNHPCTYARYVFMDTYLLWLSGEYTDHDLKTKLFEPAWRQINAKVIPGPVETGGSGLTVADDLNGNSSIEGTNSEGGTLTLAASNWGRETNNFWSVASIVMTLAFDTADDHGEVTSKAIWDESGYSGGTNGLTEPRTMQFPLGLIAKLNGVADSV